MKVTIYSDGTKMIGDLYLPAGLKEAGKQPAVIDVDAFAIDRPGLTPLPRGCFRQEPTRYAGDIGRMLQMVENRKLNPGKLVHRKIPLEEASGVLESMDKYGTVGVTVINQY